MPFYVGVQRELPKGKRGRCVATEDMLTKREREVLHSGVSLNQQAERFGFFVFETWECPQCHGNIWILDNRTIRRHICQGLQSGAYVTTTMTTSGKRFKRSQFMSFKDILRLVGKG